MTTHVLTRRITSDVKVIRFIQAACFLAAALIPYLAFQTFGSVDFEPAQLVLGVIGAMLMATFYATLGVLLEIKAKAL